MNTVTQAPFVSAESSVEIRVRGRVQGVGFRPMVWRHARELGLGGVAFNDGDGLLVRARGSSSAVMELIARMRDAPPPLSSVADIEMNPYDGALPATFEIAESVTEASNTEIAPDAALCADCAVDVFDPFSRRFRYPFTTCTNCGPRLTVVRRLPYDRANTSLGAFDLCAPCAVEYNDPANRRFRAETIACHSCGPRARLIRFDGKAFSFDQTSMLDDVDAALGLIQRGEIVAIKGLGGYHLACDATRDDAVTRLRSLKHRDRRPFALMARDLDIIRRYCTVNPEEESALHGTAAPIVLLRGNGPERLSDAVAPGLNTLGFMLPPTPLHALMLRRMSRPVVMTSGNISNAPPVISDRDAASRLGSIASFALVHDRDIVNRVDDSVVRFAAGEMRVLRRARGYAPGAMKLPSGFESSPELLATGGDLKSAFCVVKNGCAVLSQHLGDLDDLDTLQDFVRAIHLYRQMLDTTPHLIAADLHPGYRSVALAKTMSRAARVPLVQVQHHHAHIASCLAENGRPIDAPRVLGVALDGLGYGSDGSIWGGEFLLANYSSFERLGTFKPVAMLGGDQASREPWRNLYAHLMAEMSWAAFEMNFGELDVFRRLSEKPRRILDVMLRDGMNAPKASSCGRLFDAVAAAAGLCFEQQSYEGEAASHLESIVDEETLRNGDPALDYPFTIPRLKDSKLPYIEPVAAWNAILGDLILKTPAAVISARFHRGLARVIAGLVVKVAKRGSEGGGRFDTVALSGGCFHNRVLLEEVKARLESREFTVLTHSKTPAGDGGLALGQAVIAASRALTQQP